MNEYATKVLDAYLDAEKLSVPHAILIEGPWGSGKTYFLEKVYEPQRMERLRKQKRHHTPFLFVSLFGATSAQDVEMRIYKAACPGEAVAGSLAGTLALGIGEFFKVKDATKVVLDQVVKRAIKRLNNFVFVFDDLERIEEKALGEVMGLVNAFVAQHERRVILVTDETKLRELHEGKNWKDQNEKIIGRRARIEPDVENVIRTSVSELHDGPTKKFMADRVNDLIGIARTSEAENLRNLSWAIHNAASFVECLVADGEIPPDHVARTMSVVIATTLWLRTGKLDEEALKRLPGLPISLAVHSLRQRREGEHEDPTMIMAKAFSAAFSTLNVESPPVDYSLIHGFELSGVFDRDGVISWIKSQFGFGSQHEEPAWRKLWYSYERPFDQTEQALTALSQQLARREHTSQGIILHAAGLAIKFKQANDTRLTGGQDIISFFKNYIDVLVRERRFQVHEGAPVPIEYDAPGGLGFSSRDTDEFREIFRHMRQRLDELTEVSRGERVEAILCEAEGGNCEALFKLTLPTDPDLSRNPVLINVDVNRMGRLIARDLPSLSVGGRLLAYRYHHVPPGSPILSEISWARQVYTIVENELGQWPDPYRTIAQGSLRGVLRHYEESREPEGRVLRD